MGNPVSPSKVIITSLLKTTASSPNGVILLIRIISESRKEASRIINANIKNTTPRNPARCFLTLIKAIMSDTKSKNAMPARTQNAISCVVAEKSIMPLLY